LSTISTSPPSRTTRIVSAIADPPAFAKILE
jgi:hypothetical protein